MKAFNRRKNPKEHFLFKFKGRKLTFVNPKWDTEPEYFDSAKGVSFKILRRNKLKFLKTIRSYDRSYEFFELINNKIGIYDIGDMIKSLERIHCVKIKELGFKTKDFKNFGTFDNFIEKVRNQGECND